MAAETPLDRHGACWPPRGIDGERGQMADYTVPQCDAELERFKVHGSGRFSWTGPEGSSEVKVENFVSAPRDAEGIGWIGKVPADTREYAF